MTSGIAVTLPFLLKYALAAAALWTDVFSVREYQQECKREVQIASAFEKRAESLTYWSCVPQWLQRIQGMGCFKHPDESTIRKTTLSIADLAEIGKLRLLTWLE